jgi:hypothetical protein
VSDRGNVYSFPRAATAGGPVRPQVNSRGYRQASLSRYGRVRIVPVGRLVLLAFAGQPHPGQRARHRGSPGDDSLGNLYWG